MTRSFNTRNALTRIAEVVTLTVMVGMSLAPVAMAYQASPAEPAKEITRLPTVVVTAKGAQEVTRFETVYVTGKRTS